MSGTRTPSHPWWLPTLAVVLPCLVAVGAGFVVADAAGLGGTALHAGFSVYLTWAPIVVVVDLGRREGVQRAGGSPAGDWPMLGRGGTGAADDWRRRLGFERGVLVTASRVWATFGVVLAGLGMAFSDELPHSVSLAVLAAAAIWTVVASVAVLRARQRLARDPGGAAERAAGAWSVAQRRPATTGAVCAGFACLYLMLALGAAVTGDWWEVLRFAFGSAFVPWFLLQTLRVMGAPPAEPGGERVAR